MEIELKLLLDTADLARVLRTRAISQARRNRATSATLHAIYYDTPDRLLWQNRVALRLRREGRRWVQAVKGAGCEIGGLHSREEFEWTLPRQAIDLDLLAATPFAKIFSKARVRKALAPAFETVFRRRTIELSLEDGSTALLCLDLGEIRAGTRREPLCEVEIELKQGEPQALLAFAEALLEEVPFRIGTRSKAERGYVLAAAGRSAQRAVHAERVSLDGVRDARAAFGAIVQSVAAQVHANERGFLGRSEPEHLHQLRVGLRRLRVALTLPQDKAWEAQSQPVRQRLRELSQQLGAVRNWDVFASGILNPMRAQFGSEQVGALRLRGARRRAAALITARNAMRGRASTQLWLALARIMVMRASAVGAQPVRAWAAQNLTRRYRGLAKRAAVVAATNGADAEGTARLHELRIAAKKLRYVCEFFADLYPRRKVKHFLTALGELQEVLGEINDAAVGRTLVQDAAQGPRPLDAHASGLALGWIAAGLAHASRGVIRKFMIHDKNMPLARLSCFWE